MKKLGVKFYGWWVLVSLLGWLFGQHSRAYRGAVKRHRKVWARFEYTGRKLHGPKYTAPYPRHFDPGHVVFTIWDGCRRYQ